MIYLTKEDLKALKLVEEETPSEEELRCRRLYGEWEHPDRAVLDAREEERQRKLALRRESRRKRKGSRPQPDTPEQGG